MQNPGRGFIEHSFFVEGLPSHFNEIRLESAFNKFGRLTDVYVPRKLTTRSNARFGFVRYASAQQAEIAIGEMNGKLVENQKIRVAWAKYGKRKEASRVGNTRNHRLGANHGGRKEWKMKNQVQSIKLVGVEAEQSKIIPNINCDINEETGRTNGEKLNRNHEWPSRHKIPFHIDFASYSYVSETHKLGALQICSHL